MATTYNPSIVRDGLILSLDASSNRCVKNGRSLINWDTWIAGETGSAIGYTQNGTTDENRRVLDTTPFGTTDVVWDTPSNDAADDGDGGFNTWRFRIDNTKMYRFSVWIRRKTIVSPDPGSVYLGLRGYDNTNTNVGVLVRSSGSNSTNPYFYVSSGWLGGGAGEWLLFVGHVWPVGSGTGKNHPLTGIYKTDGTVVSRSQNDYVWRTNNYYAMHRSYLFYSTTTTGNQQWYQPRVDVVDGTEPSLEELLNNPERTWFDNTGSKFHAKLAGSTVLAKDGIDMGTAQQVTNYFTIPAAALNGKSSWTLEFWLKRSVINTGSIDTIMSCGAGNDTLLTYTNIQMKMEHSNPNAVWGDYSITDGEVFQFVATGTGTSVKFYKNGQLSSEIVSPAPITVAHELGIIFGQEPDANTASAPGFAANQCWRGKYYNVKFYDRVLTDAEIQQNYIAMRGKYV